MTLVAPRIVNDVSYVTTIKHASHSVWQAQYFARLDLLIFCWPPRAVCCELPYVFADCFN